jgi:hypothetical protein
VAVDSHAQVIVAWGVTQAAADVGQLVPLLDQTIRHVGQRPGQVPADAGYFSEANLTAPQFAGIKLQTAAGRAVYAQRKTIPEPVFGQIKQARGFRRFWLRGIRKVQAEWALICLTHNLLKLFRAQAYPAPS